MLCAKQREAFEVARGLDPNRSFVAAAGGAWEVAGGLADIAVDLGSSLQNTGREAFYQPWWARLGRVAGFYGSSEPSATTTGDSSKVASLNRLMGWVMIDGDMSLILYHDLAAYIREEKESGWFTKNKNLISLVGKSIPEAPEIVVFRSALTLRYFPRHVAAPWRWDLGRGELNSGHYNWGYASERELKLGLPKTCKVLVDSGSEIMDQATVDAIAAFVSNGGTFVALHNTGKHDPIQSNTWPVDRLTGCNVVGTRTKGKVWFESDLTVFKGLEGKEFEGDGIALDYVGVDSAKGESIGLKPRSKDVKVIAKLNDGTAAVTCRTIGKGRVVCLGSTFWRSARDRNGAWISKDDRARILSQLFTDLGVDRHSDATSSDLWVSDAVTKNGLENWLIALNTVQSPITSNVKFRAAAKPSDVREMTSMESVPFEYADGWVVLKDVHFDNTQTKVFSIKRADLAAGIPFWWNEKLTYWKACNVPADKAETCSSAVRGTLKFDEWKFDADRYGKVSAQSDWNAQGFNDRAWDKIGLGPWNELKEDLKDYAGTGLYRASFTIPDAWKGSAITLNLASPQVPAVLGEAEFFINGKKVENVLFSKESKQPHMGYSTRVVIDPLLEKGTNVLAVAIKGGAKWGGEVLSGFGGVVYLAAEKPMNPMLDLGASWSLAKQEESSATSPFSPVNAKGKYLSKDFEVPATWAGRSIYLRVETETPWLAGIFVNDKLLVAPSFRRLGRYVEWNISAWIHPGKSNHIELWSSAIPLYNSSEKSSAHAETKLDLISAKIGCLN